MPQATTTCTATYTLAQVDIDTVALYDTVDRSRVNTVRDDNVMERSFSAWAALEAPLGNRLRADVLPALEEILGDGAIERMGAMSARAAAERRALERFAADYDNGNTYKRVKNIPDSEFTGDAATDAGSPLTTADVEREFSHLAARPERDPDFQPNVLPSLELRRAGVA